MGKPYRELNDPAIEAFPLARVAGVDEVVAGPRHRGVVAVFLNVNDESGQYCSGTTHQPDGTSTRTGKMSCGYPGKVSAVEWAYLGRRGTADVYRFTRTFPVGTPAQAVTTAEVAFAGARVVAFEDADQRIVMIPPKPFRAPEPPR